MNCQPLEAGLEAVQLGLEHAESHDWQGEKCISDYVNYVHCFVRQRCYKNNRTEKGKPAERWGRKATGLREYPRTAGLPVKKALSAPSLSGLRELLSSPSRMTVEGSPSRDKSRDLVQPRLLKLMSPSRKDGIGNEFSQ